MLDHSNLLVASFDDDLALTPNLAKACRRMESSFHMSRSRLGQIHLYLGNDLVVAHCQVIQTERCDVLGFVAFVADGDVTMPQLLRVGDGASNC